MEEEARQVAQAVQQLLSHAHSAKQQRAADCWLNEYSQQSSAWQTSLLLLEHPQAEVAYFASNILLAKVRREWSELDAGAQAAVQAGLSAALQARSGQPSLLLRRLVLLLAAVAARSAPAAAAQLAAQRGAAISLPGALMVPSRGALSPASLLDPLLRSAGCGFFYGLLAFHLQRVDPDDGHLQAGLVGAVCGIRSLGAGAGGGLAAPLPPGATLLGVAPSLMMELAWAWLPLWLPLVGSALLLHGIRRLTPSLLPTLRP